MLITGVIFIVVGVILVIAWAIRQGFASGARAMKEAIRDKYEDLRS